MDRPARTVVLVPGTLVSASSYDAVARLLRDARPRLPPDGGENTTRDDAGVPGALEPAVLEWMREVRNPTLPRVAAAVARLVGERGNGPAIVVGHSTGAAIAARAAADHPAAVAGLVLVDGGPNMRAHASIDAMLAGLRAAATDAQWRAYAELNVSSGAPELREAWIRGMVAFSHDVGAGPAAAALESQHATDFLCGPLAERCRAWGAGRASGNDRDGTPRPVEVLHGELDAKRGPDDARAWSAVFPGARMTVLPGCGHTPPLEAPDAVAAAVLRVAAALRRPAA